MDHSSIQARPNLCFLRYTLCAPVLFGRSFYQISAGKSIGVTKNKGETIIDSTKNKGKGMMVLTKNEG
jgi:hypothetical protein